MRQAAFALLGLTLVLYVSASHAQNDSTTTEGLSSLPADPDEYPRERCLMLPGCTRCKKAPSILSTLQQGRRLQAAVDQTRVKLSGFSKSPNIYTQLNLPYCLECNTTGYALGTKGRCFCAPGYGDDSPTGVCNFCPDSTFSQGGLSATCIDCDGPTFSSDDGTQCGCLSGYYGKALSTGKVSCTKCPTAKPVSPYNSTNVAACLPCARGMMPSPDYEKCIPFQASPPPPPGQDVFSTTVPKILATNNITSFPKVNLNLGNTGANTPIHDIFGAIVDNLVGAQSKNSTDVKIGNFTVTVKNLNATPSEILYNLLTAKTNTPDPKQVQAAMSGLQSLTTGLATALPALATAAPNLLPKEVKGQLDTYVNSLLKSFNVSVPTDDPPAAAATPDVPLPVAASPSPKPKASPSPKPKSSPSPSSSPKPASIPSTSPKPVNSPKAPASASPSSPSSPKGSAASASSSPKPPSAASSPSPKPSSPKPSSPKPSSPKPSSPKPSPTPDVGGGWNWAG